MCFLSWKYSHHFEFVSAKVDNNKVCCTLCWRQSTIKLQKHKVKFEETFGVAAQLGLQSKSHQVVLSRALRAKPQPRLLQQVPHHPNNKS